MGKTKKAKSTASSVKPKAEAKPKEQFIITYDVYGEDPVKVVNSLEEAKKFVEKLLTEGDDNESAENISNVKVYKGVLIGKPKIIVEFI